MTYVFNIKECEKIDPLYVTQKAKESPTDRKGSGYSPVLIHLIDSNFRAVVFRGRALFLLG